MLKFSTNTQAALKLSPALLAAAALSACTSPRVGPTAGASSSWAPQSYEQNGSTAAVTSTLGGSALRLKNVPSYDYSSVSVVNYSGSLRHNSGRIDLSDGTYLFVDTNGPTAAHNLDDGLGATGIVDAGHYYTHVGGGVYKYVSYYLMQYTDSGQHYGDYGFAGIVTAEADMPTAGTATYSSTLDSDFRLRNLNNVHTASELTLNSGATTVDVNFGAGTASVDLHNYTSISNGNGTTLNATTTPLDEVKGTGLTISGAHFTGGTWVTMKGGSVVNLLGASPVATAQGTFFGYNSAISAPAEVAGIVVIKGTTMEGHGYFMAQ